jgi:DNA-binding CsgD family transcriptional regulator
VAKARKTDEKNPSEKIPSWSRILDDIAGSRTHLVMESPSGARVVLIAEDEFLRRADSVVPSTISADRLSKREIEILSLVGAGNSGTQIATQLGLAANTVAQHLVSVRRKLNVATTAAAVEVAKRSDLL